MKLTLTLMSTMLLISLYFIQYSHPLILIILLIAQTILGAILINCAIQFPWFSYTLVLVFLGGMLILFMYVSNLVPNEMMKMKNIMMTAFSFFILEFMLLWNNKYLNIFNNNGMDLTLKKEMIYSISVPFNMMMMPFTIFMAMFIIISLLVIIKMINLPQGPLRLI